DRGDTHLETDQGRAEPGVPSAGAALRLGLGGLLRLCARVLPSTAEEVWSWAFAEETGHASIHAAPWPGAREFAPIPPPAEPASFEAAVGCLAAINKRKSEAGVSVGRAVVRLALVASPTTLTCLGPVAADVMAAARVAEYALQPRAGLDGAFEVVEVEFAALET